MHNFPGLDAAAYRSLTRESIIIFVVVPSFSIFGVSIDERLYVTDCLVDLGLLSHHQDVVGLGILVWHVNFDLEVTSDVSYLAAPLPDDAVEEFQECKVEEAVECGVCLGEIDVGELAKLMPCGHKFHPECLKKWLLEYNDACPFKCALQK